LTAHVAATGNAARSLERRRRAMRMGGWNVNPREEHVMRMRETWLAISPSKKTVMFSTAGAARSVPPLQRVYNGLLVVELGSRKASEAEDMWFAVSEESMTPSP